MPASHDEFGRADWILRLGRKPVTIPSCLRKPDQPVIIEARRAGEPDDATPVDRIYLHADEALPLLLPSGEFRVTAWPGDGDPQRVVVE
ncbi:MAG TPA: hypothetical protein VF339_20040 [Gammaproteobacteria bacterium]